MWALLSTRLRTWLLFAILVPLAGVVARAAARRLERRHGSTRLSRALRTASDAASRRDRKRDEAYGGPGSSAPGRPVTTG